MVVAVAHRVVVHVGWMTEAEANEGGMNLLGNDSESGHGEIHLSNREVAILCCLYIAITFLVPIRRRQRWWTVREGMEDEPTIYNYLPPSTLNTVFIVIFLQIIAQIYAIVWLLSGRT